MLVARLLRQLLLALQHVTACGVEHQDVKPENMLLYGVSLEEQRAELKLGDFGWAVAQPNNGGSQPVCLYTCIPEFWGALHGAQYCVAQTS